MIAEKREDRGAEPGRDRLPRIALGIARPRRWRTVLGPGAFAAAAIGLLIYDHLHRRVSEDVFWLGIALIGAVFLWLVGKASAATINARRDTLTDRLTGLGSRAKLDIDLAAALRARHPQRRVLVALKLDGLESYNDSSGREAGDRLLATVGSWLAAAAAELDGSAYRIGGSLLAVLADGYHIASAVVDAVSAAPIDGDGEHLIDIFHGDVTVPEETDDPKAAIAMATRRIEARRSRERRSARGQARDVLLELIAARRPEDRKRTLDAAHWAIEVGRRLGLQREELEDIVLATKLRDVGLLTVREPMPAGEAPRRSEPIRMHPIAGEHVIKAAPALTAVATLVRSVNERFDGSGYPDGLRGEAIPLGARIVAVCVAFATETAQRRPGETDDGTLAELRRHAGTRFDPRVLDALAGTAAQASAVEDARALAG